MSQKTRQIVEDLKTLRKLLACLVTHDAVTFLDLLTNLKAMHSDNASPAFWIMTQAANRLFENARDRVYTIHMSEGANPRPSLERVLEPNPKWTLVNSVLEEIAEHRNQLEREGVKNVGVTLIVCRDERTAVGARDVICYGTERCLAHSFKRFCAKRREAYMHSYKKRGRGSGEVMNDKQRELELLSREAERPDWAISSALDVPDPLLGVGLKAVHGWIEKDAASLAAYLRGKGGGAGMDVMDVDGIARAGVFEAFGAAVDLFDEVMPQAKPCTPRPSHELQSLPSAPIPRDTCIYIFIYISTSTPTTGSRRLQGF